MIQGIGAGFVPALLNRKVIDEVIAISDDEAFTTRRLARKRGSAPASLGGHPGRRVARWRGPSPPERR